MPNSGARLHFLTMCHSINGGFDSAMTLLKALKEKLDITIWSLLWEASQTNRQIIEETGLPFKLADRAARVDPQDHVFFYMNEYPRLFSNISEYWPAQLSNAASVQIAFNRTTGSLCREHWLSDVTDKIYFQDTTMRGDWEKLVAYSPLNTVPTRILPPPVALNDFFEIPVGKTIVENSEEKIILGRLAGDVFVPANAVEFYQKLSAQLPNAEFWFMPTPEILRNVFLGNPQFKFFQRDEITVIDFFKNCDIYMLTYASNVPIPGPRSLVEAMAAGCAPIVINRNGPKDRVIHGESGFCAGNDDEFIHYAHKLADDPELRSKISTQARLRATTFKVETWVDEILTVINNKEIESSDAQS